MTLKENYMLAIHKKIPESVPVFSKPVRFNVGLMDPFEKGPKGGGKDGYGVTWIAKAEGHSPSTAVFALTDVTKWREQVTFPDLDAIDWEAKAAAETAGFDPETQVLEYAMGNGPFERMLAWMGYQNLIYALVDEPEACHELLDAWADHRVKFVELVCKYYKPDFITIYDDVAYEKGLFLSPGMYREFIKPIHIRVNEAIRANGALPLNHCCGKAELLVEDFIEEDAEAWCSCQPSNDLAGLLEKYHDKMCFIGGFDSNGAPSQMGATEEMRRAEVRRCIDTYAKWGSYIFGNHIFANTDPRDRMTFMTQANDEAYTYGKDFYRKA